MALSLPSTMPRTLVTKDLKVVLSCNDITGDITITTPGTGTTPTTPTDRTEIDG